jgi:DNA-binding transcriptional LysR family regulator
LKLSLRQLQIFIAIAERETTTAAAIAVSLSQSAVSSALAELETSLDAKVFDRIGRRLLLNDVGRALLPDARAVLAAVNEIEGQFGSGLRAGRRAVRLRLAASTSIGNYLLPRLLAEFCRDAFDPQIELRIGNTSEVCASLARFEADLGFIEGPAHDSALAVLPWMRDEMVVVSAPDHLLAHTSQQEPVSLDQLRQAPWLLREAGSGTREVVEQMLLPQLRELHCSMHFGSNESIKQAAAAGLGISCLSHGVVSDLIELGRLVKLKTVLTGLNRRLYLVHHSKKVFSAPMQAFFEFCVALESPALV